MIHWLAVLLCCAGSSAAYPPPDTEYAFFEQSTIASHTDGYNHGLPCMALLEDGRLLAAWSRWKPDSLDFAVVGAFSSDGGCSWKPAQVLLDTPELLDADPSIIVSGNRVFVTVTTVSGKGIHSSVTRCVRSEDNGSTWSEPYEIPMNHRYTCGKCHRGIRLASGVLLMGYSWDLLCEAGETLTSEGQMDLRAGVMRSTDNGETWTNGGDTHAIYEKIAAGAVLGTDEPAVVALEDGTVYMLMRTGGDHLYESRSLDEGLTWSAPQPSPLTGSNAPAALASFDAGGKKGIFVVWDNALERKPLCAAASFDGGKSWTPPKDIGFPYPAGQASYPSCVQGRDGALLAVWQQDMPGGRDIRMARFSPAWLLANKEKIVLFGDSTTAPRGPLTNYGALLQQALGDRVEIGNAGVGGNTTDQARARFEKEVLDLHPNIVIIQFGINDACVDVWRGQNTSRVSREAYEANLRYFLAELKNRQITPILMTPNPLAWTDELKRLYGKLPYDPENADGFNGILKEYAEIVRKVAREEAVRLLDVYQCFLDAAPACGGSISPLLLDGMHPNEWGHRLVATGLSEILDEFGVQGADPAALKATLSR